MPTERRHLDGHARNAALSWGLIAAVLASVLESLLDGDLLWAGFSAAVVAIVLAPAVVARRPAVLVDWKVLSVSALPAIARAFDVVAAPIAYVSIAALALLVVAEIDAFTAARMTPRFAALSVVLTTLSVAGAWAVVQFASDTYLATDYLGDTNDLMWDLVAASAVGLGAGAGFEWYCSGQSLSRVLDGGA